MRLFQDHYSLFIDDNINTEDAAKVLARVYKTKCNVTPKSVIKEPSSKDGDSPKNVKMHSADPRQQSSEIGNKNATSSGENLHKSQQNPVGKKRRLSAEKSINTENCIHHKQKQIQKQQTTSETVQHSANSKVAPDKPKEATGIKINGPEGSDSGIAELF